MTPNAPTSSACFTTELIISAPFWGTRTRGVTAIWRWPFAAVLCLSVMPRRKTRSVSGLHGPCSMSMMMKSRPDRARERALLRDRSELMIPKTASLPSRRSITRLRRVASVSCALSSVGAIRPGGAREVHRARRTSPRQFSTQLTRSCGVTAVSWVAGLAAEILSCRNSSLGAAGIGRQPASLTAAWAAARRATGTRNGEQLT